MIAPSDKHLVAMLRVHKEFGSDRRTVAAVKDVSLVLHTGECVVLLGPSGSGKTTLLTMAAGFAVPTRGELLLFGKALQNYTAKELQLTRARRVGFVFQTFRLLEPLTAEENIMLACEFAGLSRAESRARSQELLQHLCIQSLARARPSELSQGEKQRVAVARALVNRPELILADEPTASLESSQARDLMDCLASYVAANSAGLLVATHDLRMLSIASRTIQIEDGRLKESETNSFQTATPCQEGNRVARVPQLPMYTTRQG